MSEEKEIVRQGKIGDCRKHPRPEICAGCDTPMNPEPMNDTHYTCAVCKGPMEVKGVCNKCQPPEPFHPEYFWAFCALLLAFHEGAAGEEEVFISLKHLQRFPIDRTPLVYWNPQLQGWIMKNRPQKAAIVEPSKVIVTGKESR